MKKQLGMIMFLIAALALMAAVACGASATEPLPTQPPPTETPVKGPPPPEEPDTPETIEIPAPIEDTALVPPKASGGEYILRITSGLPNGCAEFSGYTVERNGDAFVVLVTNLMPADPFVACTEIYGYHEGEVLLGSGLDAGGVYTVAVNDDWDVSFTAQDTGDLGMIEKESPIEEFEIAKFDGGYVMTVISRLPLGSSCSKFSGYEINRRFAGRIEVTVTHMEVTADNIPCTADLPVVVTEIPLGGDFAEGQTYVVSVNGTEETFPQDMKAPVEVPAPIEKAKVAAPENPGGEYILEITSGLPSGCARFNEIRSERNGNLFLVDVTNLVPNPDEPIACTAIYGYHDSSVSLGSGLEAGEAYTVIVNGESSNSFTVPNAGGPAMVENESPIERFEIAKVDGGYVMTVISRLPLGSSCSKFNGYEINRRFAGRIEVTITHMEVAEKNVSCTDDYPAVMTDIPLGPEFDGLQTYTISVNGTETTFLGAGNTQTGDSASGGDATPSTPGPVEHETVEVQAPLEGSTIDPPETAGSPYILKITSGLPSGCARFSAYHSSQNGNDFNVEVMNRIPADRTIACTAIYGYYEGQLTLGDGALTPGETYTVSINSQLAHTFTVK